ncbi:ribosome maturation factor RimP [soil metagenome]|jgi:ribosome maturation factor RimP
MPPDARVRDLVAPLADAAAVDLVDVQIMGAGARTLVRIVIDRKGGVDLAVCQRFSNDVSALLDAEDPIDARYVLEVTSPGVDHPLRDRRAFDRVEGRPVLVHRKSGDGAVRQLSGTVLAAREDDVELDVEGAAVRVQYAEIVKATQALPW